MAASDIDPVSIEVTEENAGINNIPLGRARGPVELAVATGLEHSRLKTRAPYHLTLANILARPLTDLAASVAGELKEGGTLIMAGMLDTPAARVAAAYRHQGPGRSYSPHRRARPCR